MVFMLEGKIDCLYFRISGSMKIVLNTKKGTFMKLKCKIVIFSLVNNSAKTYTFCQGKGQQYIFFQIKGSKGKKKLKAIPFKQSKWSIYSNHYFCLQARKSTFAFLPAPPSNLPLVSLQSEGQMVPPAS